MNNIEKAFNKVDSVGQFSKKYFTYLYETLKEIDVVEIDNLGKVLDSARFNEKTIFVAGNGGSAATASTIANDLGFDIIKKTKMILIYNALEKGCKIKKRNNSYIFTKNHEGKKEVLLDNYIKRFIETNLNKKI